MTKPRKPPPADRPFGSEYAAFIAPSYRGVFLFLLFAVVALVSLSSTGFWASRGLGAFVDERVRTTWAEAALKAKTEHLQYEGQLKDHGGRLEKLEQQNQETRSTLAEIRNAVLGTAETLREVREELKRQAAAMQASDLAAARGRPR